MHCGYIEGGMRFRFGRFVMDGNRETVENSR